ncbi:hypothetical protein [Cochleicola gelatinilyticus]|uniref:CHASE2 domain-containing protein n=1 Tax=Cochleicola gelatinilyticus TaxID=1763537 RepID=A0A167F0Y8_9FLAO|nr:hypothetical protein [Cochleicola gelatinilyticus]OAB76077.1 hypothetical protein ULVI_13545 [Cochleicola gelatinilyticus]
MNRFRFLNQKVVLLCVLNTIVGLLVFFLLQKNHILPGDNSTVFHLGPKVKAWFASEKPALDGARFLIIDTSKDYMVVDNARGDLSEDITNGVAVVHRGLLLRFMDLLNKTKDYNYVMCNILFDYASPKYDRELVHEMSSLPRFSISSGLGKEMLHAPYRDLPMADASVYMPGGTMTKYRLYDLYKQDTLRSFPLDMYTAIHETRFKHGMFYSSLGAKKVFNDFQLEKFIDRDHIQTLSLGEICSLDVTSFKAATKNKIIIIDNIEANLKKTIYGDAISMPVITANAYLALIKGDTVITWYFITFLTLCCLFFSYLISLPQGRLYPTIFDKPVIGILRGGIWYIPFFALLSVFVYFVFGNNLNLTYLGGFFYMENLFFNWKYHWKRVKRKMNFN